MTLVFLVFGPLAALALGTYQLVQIGNARAEYLARLAPMGERHDALEFALVRDDAIISHPLTDGMQGFPRADVFLGLSGSQRDIYRQRLRDIVQASTWSAQIANVMGAALAALALASLVGATPDWWSTFADTDSRAHANSGWMVLRLVWLLVALMGPIVISSKLKQRARRAHELEALYKRLAENNPPPMA